MSYRIVMRPDKNLGLFNDATDTWVDQALGDEDAVNLLCDAEGIDPDEARKMIGQLRAGRLRKEYDGYVMTWAEAEWRTGGRDGNQPLARDAKGMRLLAHGTGGWRRGCKCDICTDAHLEDNRKRYSMAGRDLTHGLSGYAQGCKCEICTDAKAAYQRSVSDSPPRPQGDEARTEYLSTLYTAAEWTLIKLLAAEVDVPARSWIRDAHLAVLRERTGYEPASRPARAQKAGPGKTARPGGDTRDVTVNERYTPRERTLIEQLAEEDGMPVSRWLREPVLAILEERAGYEDEARRAAPRRRNFRPRARGSQAAGNDGTRRYTLRRNRPHRAV